MYDMERVLIQTNGAEPVGCTSDPVHKLLLRIGIQFSSFCVPTLYNHINTRQQSASQSIHYAPLPLPAAGGAGRGL